MQDRRGRVAVYSNQTQANALLAGVEGLIPTPPVLTQALSLWSASC